MFFPDRNDLRGFFEHARGRSAIGLLGAAWRTWWWTVWPWGLYRRVLITHRIVLWRVALWLVWLILPLHALAAMLAMARVAVFPVSGLGVRGAGADWSTYLSCWTYPVATVDVGAGMAPGAWRMEWPVIWTPLYVAAALAMHATFALMCVALPWTLGAAKVRFGHWARAVVYGLAWLPLLSVFRVVRNAWLLLELAADAKGGMTGMGVLGWGGPMPVRLGDVFPDACAMLLLGWMMAWWAAVFVRGWKVKQAWGVWALLGVASGVAAGGTWMMLDVFWYW